MKTELVVRGHRVTAIAASPTRLYVSDGNIIKIYSRDSFELERIAQIPAKKLVYDDSKDCVVILDSQRAYIYTSDLRKKLYTFDSGSASLIDASRGTIVLASKRRIRWVKWSDDEWKSDSLAISGASSLCIAAETVYVASGAVVHAADLTARVVRQLPIKLPTGWGTSTVHMCFSEGLVVVSGSQAWYKQQEFTIDPPTTIGPLGKFWIAGYKTRMDMYYGTTIVFTQEVSVIGISKDGFISTTGGVLEVKPHITVKFIQNLFNIHPKFALSLSNGLNDPEINEIRIKQAHSLLSKECWQEAISLFEQASTSPVRVISEFSPFLDSINEPSAGPSTSSVVSHISTTDRLEIPSIEALIPYLTLQRRRINIERAASQASDDGHSPDTSSFANQLEAIDTCLFRCYHLSNSSLIGPLVRNTNHCDTEIVISKLKKLGRWRDLVGFLQTRDLHKDALTILQEQGSPAGVITYLDTIDSWDMVKQFAPDAIHKEPHLAEILFSEASYNPHDVYLFLQANKSEYTLKYLQSKVKLLQDDAAIHEDLALFYLDKNLHEDLNNFLRSSAGYRTEAILSKVPEELYLTRVILLGKLGQYEKVIDTCISHDDLASAEKYCADTYKNNQATGEKALSYLYDYVVAKFPNQLVAFLNNQGYRLGTERTLPDLSDDIKMSEMSSFFTKKSRESSKNQSKSVLTRTLAQAALSESTHEWAQLRAVSVRIDSTSACKHCKKRLGLSVVGVWKGLALHYGCIDAFRSIY